jgi:hypothetical protein
MFEVPLIVSGKPGPIVEDPVISGGSISQVQLTSRSPYSLPRSWFLALLLALLIAACTGRNARGLPTYLLRQDDLNLDQLGQLMIKTISSRLESEDVFGSGFPALGHTIFEPDPANPSGQIIHCQPEFQAKSDGMDCLLLDEAGSFLRVQSINWESAAFYAYRVYLVPDQLFYSVNPALNFIALDFFMLDGQATWERIDQAIRAAAQDVGAKPFRP